MWKVDKLCVTLLLAGASGAYAAGDVCQPVFEAQAKMMVTPTHIYHTETAAFRNNQTRNGEMIYTGGETGAIYVMVDGKWHRSTLTVAGMLKQEAENRAETQTTCQYVREEVVDGEAAQVYSGHSANDTDKVVFTVWISKRRGLPLKQDIDMDVGGAMGKSHRSLRYEYTNVRPPAGVQ